MNRFHRPISEQDTQAGYVDFFRMPRLEVFSDMQHSYILGRKYAKRNDSDTVVQHLRSQTSEQAIRCAETERVQRSIGHTQLHRVVVVYRGLKRVSAIFQLPTLGECLTPGRGPSGIRPRGNAAPGSGGYTLPYQPG